MAKTQYYTATSVDGFIADADNSLDWLFAVESRGDDAFGPFFTGVGAFAMGATTYEWVLEHDALPASRLTLTAVERLEQFVHLTYAVGPPDTSSPPGGGS